MVQQQDVRQGHPYFMYDAIMRQPEAMEEMLTKHATSVQPVAAELAKKRRVYHVGSARHGTPGWWPDTSSASSPEPGRWWKCATPLSSAPTRRL